jgi:8-amino-7-oxononanoate synthase
VRPIVPPTVPRGTERVRVCLHAGNTVEEIDALVKRIGEWVIAQGPRDGRDAKL